jgi:nucleotide-binding universal stress UspA family protein
MSIREIIFPVDFSSHNAAACPYVAAVAKCLDAKLILLHVVEDQPPHTTALDRLHTAEELGMEERKSAALSSLNAFRSQYIPHLNTEVHVLSGDPAKVITIFAGDGDHRVIMIPTNGYGPFRRMLLGSVTAKVLHDARCPVWTGPHLDVAINTAEWFALRHILCAVANNWETDDLLRRSAALASHLGAELTAFHALAPLEEGLLEMADEQGRSLSLEPARKDLQDAADRVPGVAKVCVSVGEVSRAVARAAREHKADLIVIGRGGTPEMWGRLGSHAYAIVRRAPCPVLCHATVAVQPELASSTPRL